jgi:hypothetical protein
MCKYTDEIRKFIEDNVKGISSKELAESINNVFETSFSASQIKSYKGNHKLSSGLTGRFKKGNIPFNKGKKGCYGKGCEKSWFKKGHTPINHKPVGSERIESKDGYTLVKVKEPNKWEPKQRVVYRKHHGEIQKGNKIVFLDGDRTNFNIDNLIAISGEELLIINSNNLIQQNTELTETGILIAKVIKQKNVCRRKIINKEN